jgi:membrane protease YdiL (CAAX protease family)
MLDSARAAVTVPAAELERTADSFSELSSQWILVALAPLFLTVLILGVGYSMTGGSDPGFPPEFPTLVYGIANVAVVAFVYIRVNPDVWGASALFRRPSIREVLAAVLATIVGILVGWPFTTLIADTASVARYTVPSLTSPIGIASLFFGAVIVAPVAEELLFRGLFLGIVLNRGYGPALAGVSSLVVFAGIHVFTAGFAGIVNALLLGALLTWLRLRYNNLAGAWLMHLLNNLLEFLTSLSVLPSLYVL